VGCSHLCQKAVPVAVYCRHVSCVPTPVILLSFRVTHYPLRSSVHVACRFYCLCRTIVLMPMPVVICGCGFADVDTLPPAPASENAVPVSEQASALPSNNAGETALSETVSPASTAAPKPAAAAIHLAGASAHPVIPSDQAAGSSAATGSAATPSVTSTLAVGAPQATHPPPTAAVPRHPVATTASAAPVPTTETKRRASMPHSVTAFPPPPPKPLSKEAPLLRTPSQLLTTDRFSGRLHVMVSCCT
jgi:hypothetical protein